MSLPRELEFSTDVTRHERGFCLARVRDMVRIRRLEERCAQLYGEQKIRGFLHLYVGEEAVAAGVMPQLQPQDNVVATYREHGHALLRGVSMNAIMAEMYGKQEGCSRGRGGSMHLFDRATRFFGGNAIVGGGLTGLSAALNLAMLWRLPVLFICENNLYAMGTALARSESSIDLTAKAATYGLATAHVNGMNVLAVSEAARDAVDRVRRIQTPFFLEHYI